MVRVILSLCMALLAMDLYCQQVEIFRNQEDTATFIPPQDTITKPPQYGNGEADFFKYIEEHFFIRNNTYTSNLGITVRFSFFVERDGSISDYKHIFGTNQMYSAEIERVISHMPRWTPGYYSGKKRKVMMEYDLTLRPIAYLTPPMIEISKNNVSAQYTDKTNQLKWFIVSGAVLILVTLWIIK
jgi:hypothetical protein